MREFKRDFYSPSLGSRSGAPCSFILGRTFGSRCWGGGSGGEETHGAVGCVRCVRSQKLSAKNAICWRLQPISAQRSSNSIQIGNAGCKNPPMTGALGWLNNSILLIPYLCCCSEIITHTAARLFFISPRFLLNYLVRSGSGTHMTCDLITSTDSCPETCQHIIKKMNVKAEQHDVSYVILNSIAFVLCWAAACPCQSDMGTCSVPFN